MLTLVSQIVEHTEIDEHLEEIAENLIVEHVIYTISIEINNRTPGIFFHCINSQTRLTIRDTRVGNDRTRPVVGHVMSGSKPLSEPMLTQSSVNNISAFCTESWKKMLQSYFILLFLSLWFLQLR